METSEILKTLVDLESTLQDIKSAKQDVADTVEAYSALQDVLNKYTEVLALIPDKFSSVVTILDEKQNSLAEDAQNAAKAIPQQGNKIVEEFQNACNSAGTALKDLQDKMVVEHKRIMEEVISDFKNVNNSEIEKIQSNISELSEYITNLGAIESHLGEYTKVVDSIKEQIDLLVSNFTKLDVKQNLINKEFKENLTSISTNQAKIISVLVDVKSEVSNVQENIKKGISEQLEASKGELSNLKKSVFNVQENIKKGISEQLEASKEELSNLKKSVSNVQENIKNEISEQLATIKEEDIQGIKDLITSECNKTQSSISDVQNKIDGIESKNSKFFKGLIISTSFNIILIVIVLIYLLIK